jgi:anti-sigma B factor antagonist
MSAFEQPKANVQVRTASERACVLDLKGELTTFAEDALMGAYGTVCNTRVRAVVLNFTEVDHMSSSAIGLLVTLLIRAQRHQQKRLVYGLTDHYRHILELTRLDEAIAIYTTEKEALAHGAQGE